MKIAAFVLLVVFAVGFGALPFLGVADLMWWAYFDHQLTAIQWNAERIVVATIFCLPTFFMLVGMLSLED